MTTTSRRLRRLALVGIAAAAVAAPVAGASTDQPRSVQIGGALVAPSQVSAWQVAAGTSQGASRLVQIGGELLRPADLSRWQVAAASSPVKAEETSTFTWSDAAVGAGAAIGGALLLAAAFMFVLRRRTLVTA
jgi:hypothetical protein